MTTTPIDPEAGPAAAASSIPGPPGPLAVQTLAFALARHRVLPALHRRYGPVVRLKVFPERSVISLADPAHVKEVFGGPVTTYHAGEGNMILEPVMGPSSVLTTDEEAHRRVRRLLLPPFHGAALRGYRDMVAELAEREIGRWPVGTAFAAHHGMQRLTLEVIVRVVFGIDEGPRAAPLRAAVRDVAEVGPLDVFGWHSPTLQRVGRWRRNLERRHDLDRLLHAEISDRRRAPDVAQRTDVLSLLIAAGDGADALTDDELRDQLVTLLLAGHETTATALAWSVHELARAPRVLAEATHAADDGDDAYLEAVAKEAMRLRPVIYEVARRTTHPVELGGYRIPAHTTVMPAIGVIQTSEDHHARPAEFRPERFGEGSTSPATWFPFGGGPRRCLGAGFSLMEATEVLRVLLRRHTLKADRARPERVKPRNITFVPGRGARVVLTPRSGSTTAPLV